MPKPRILFWLSALGILSVALLVAACGSSGEPELPDTTSASSGEPELPDTTSASVLAYLEEVDYQNNDAWKLWPGTEEKYQGDDPHGMLLTTYLNPAAFEAVEKSATTPDGSIIVKENYTPAGDHAANTIMYKKSGYNPDHSNWFWLKVLADGTVEKEGRVEGCQQCHGDVPDYVWGPQQ